IGSVDGVNANRDCIRIQTRQRRHEVPGSRYTEAAIDEGRRRVAFVEDEHPWRRQGQRGRTCPPTTVNLRFNSVPAPESGVVWKAETVNRPGVTALAVRLIPLLSVSVKS